MQKKAPKPRPPRIALRFDSLDQKQQIAAAAQKSGRTLYGEVLYRCCDPKYAPARKHAPAVPAIREDSGSMTLFFENEEQKEKLMMEARANNRSLNAEIIHRCFYK